MRHLLTWLRLTDQPVVKIYRGFGNDKFLTIHGTVFRRSALPRKKYRDNLLINLFGVLRLFLVKPYTQATVRVSFGKQFVETQTDTDGYFRFDVPLQEPLQPGWYTVQAELMNATSAVLTSAEGQVLVPHPTQFICVSDIDDTFLISHSATILKRLQVLMTQNAHSRQPFEGVVEHYRLLAEADTGPMASNPFFYVSSSEWNLYDYILTFSEKNGLPNGVYLLSQLKQLSQLLKTGQNKHMTKFSRIVRIIETYPAQQFILLGDDTQEDPNIYASLVEHFPNQIHCVYIRQVHGKNQPKTRETLKRIEAVGVPCCYFAHSDEAHQHSVQIGLVAS
ncbi:App1 family protein [Spirosoma soli]|uniref:App1 family protein n=1 Tax=Spirosoma soli TaxID=1770529 RepID=A0ABW5M8E4_9BACT